MNNTYSAEDTSLNAFPPFLFTYPNTLKKAKTKANINALNVTTQYVT